MRELSWNEVGGLIFQMHAEQVVKPNFSRVRPKAFVICLQTIESFIRVSPSLCTLSIPTSQEEKGEIAIDNPKKRKD